MSSWLSFDATWLLLSYFPQHLWTVGGVSWLQGGHLTSHGASSSLALTLRRLEQLRLKVRLSVNLIVMRVTSVKISDGNSSISSSGGTAAQANGGGDD